jgi:hypothetical protein
LGNPNSLAVEAQIRELALFNLAIDSKREVVTDAGEVRSRAIIVQKKKTGRPRTVQDYRTGAHRYREACSKVRPDWAGFPVSEFWKLKLRHR